MSRSKSSHHWLKEHFDDEYVKRAQQEGYRSRASFKLLEINEKDHLLKPGMTVVDLGAAPGGWAQIAADIVGAKGYVAALDILPMDPIPEVDIIEGDFREQAVLDQLLALLKDKPVDLVMSDMAPNISGMKTVDQPKAMYLAELALDLARTVLKPGGNFVVKVFQGEGFEPFLKDMRSQFDKVVSRKPKASRPRSREIYLLGKGYRG
jgi:23S rRNA (uridine2552-2'-O)-methyltransferase